MRTLWKLAVAFVVVVGIAGPGAAAPAFADTAVSTGFGFGQVNQGFFNYTDQTITLSGTLWDTAVTPNTTIANEPVTVTEQVAGTGPANDVGSATTDANGNFTVTLTDQPVGGIFQAVFAGDTANGNDYAATASRPVKVTPQLFSDVDLAYTAPPASPVTSGAPVVFSGTVYVPANDRGGTNPQTPIAGANVYVFDGSEYTSDSPHAVTDANGEFSITVNPSATTTYTIEVVASEPWPYCLYVYDTIFSPTTITVVNPQ
jgi:hypothetical protein